MSMKKQKTKTLEFDGVFLDAAHKDTGKNKKNPFTKISIAVPPMDHRLFKEMCFNDGYKICFKIEYVPRKGWEVKEKA